VSFLSGLFGSGKQQIHQALKKGAVIIDVRTAQEFDQGHPRNAINIPLDRLSAHADRIKDMGRPVLVCCHSGSRSQQALQVLKAKGLKEIYNAGGWEKLARIISSQ